MTGLSFAVVPHITDAIQEWVERVAKIPVDGDQKQPDVCIIEVIYWKKYRENIVNLISIFILKRVISSIFVYFSAYFQNCFNQRLHYKSGKSKDYNKGLNYLLCFYGYLELNFIYICILSIF